MSTKGKFAERARSFLTASPRVSTLATFMNTNQFRVLSVAGWLCAVLILADVVFTQINLRLNQAVLQTQSQLQPKINDAQQKYRTLENLAVRVAQNAQQEPSFRDLLIKLGLKVDLTVDGQTKQVP